MAALLISIIGNLWAADTHSYQFILYLRSLNQAQGPVIFENNVLFTAPSYHQRVGISFAHEGFSRVHWFQQLMLPRDVAEFTVGGRVQRGAPRTVDSGIMFHLQPVPPNITNMDYRLIIDGLWTTDPLNPNRVTGPSGVTASRFTLPERVIAAVVPVTPGMHTFTFRAPPGEIVTVGGCFNNWDPFMYRLRETSPGFYTLTLPLPPGSFQYVFFHRGEWIPNPANPRTRFSREGRIVSEAIVAR